MIDSARMLKRLEVWQSQADGGWYWRYRAGNGHVLAIGGEAFSKKDKALKSFRKLGIPRQAYRVEHMAVRP